MKNKIIIGILSVVLLLSVGGNIWLYRSAVKAETLQGQIAELESRGTQQQTMVSELETQVAGYEAQIAELQKTLEENENAASLSQTYHTTDQTGDESLDSDSSVAIDNSVGGGRDSDPAAEDTNQGGNSGGSNGGYNPNTDDDPYNDDPSYNPSKGNEDIGAAGTGNSNDPFWGNPGYEGPKEGYTYIPGYGYVSDTPVDVPWDTNSNGTAGFPTNEEYDAAGGAHHGY